MDPAELAPPPATPGQVLAETRERQGLSRAEVAQRLHMSPLQVEALEAGDYARLPKGTFLRGFVRNYAKLVGVDAEPLVAGLVHGAPGDPTPRIVVPSQNIRFEPLHERISASPYWKGGVIGVVVLLFGFAAMYWWVEIRPEHAAAAVKAPAPAVPVAQQIAAAPLPPVDVPPPVEAPKVAEPVPAAAEPKKPEPSKAEAKKADTAKVDAKKPDAPKVDPKKADPPKADAKKSEVAKAEAPKALPVAATAVPRGTGRLHFKFRGESWVEVTDSLGKVLISKVNYNGTEADVSGKPPFTVVVGNAPNVTVLYNDRDFPLEPHTKVAVARFTVE